MAQTDLLQITRVDGQPFTWTTIGLDEAVNPAPISITGYAMVYGITNNVQVSETQISLIPFSYGFEEYANQQPSVGSTAVWIPQGGLPFQISDITLTTDFATDRHHLRQCRNPRRRKSSCSQRHFAQQPA